jgi:hypothetical protein
MFGHTFIFRSTPVLIYWVVGIAHSEGSAATKTRCLRYVAPVGCVMLNQFPELSLPTASIP